jgi:hypothetical protein
VKSRADFSRECSREQPTKRETHTHTHRERETERNDDANEAHPCASPVERNVQDRACTLRNFVVRVCTPVIKMSTSRDSQDSAPFLRRFPRGFHGLFPPSRRKAGRRRDPCQRVGKKIDRAEFQQRGLLRALFINASRSHVDTRDTGNSM